VNVCLCVCVCVCVGDPVSASAHVRSRLAHYVPAAERKILCIQHVLCQPRTARKGCIQNMFFPKKQTIHNIFLVSK
jgi:hypothetical protein